MDLVRICTEKNKFTREANEILILINLRTEHKDHITSTVNKAMSVLGFLKR